MPDDMLLSFAKEESDHLTTEARQLLQEELKGRSLTLPVEEEHAVENTVTPDRDILLFIIEQKGLNKPDEQIIASLLEKDIPEEQAGYIMQHAFVLLKSLIKKYDQAMLMGILLFMSGLAVSFLPMNPEKQRLVYILAYATMLLGAIRFFNGLFYKRKYTRVEQSMEQEKRGH